MSVHKKRTKWSTSNLVNIAFSPVLSLANFLKKIKENLTAMYKKCNYWKVVDAFVYQILYLYVAL